MLRNFAASAALLAGLAAIGMGSQASASVTLHFAEANGAVNYSFGRFGSASRPVKLDFTVASPLLANQHYNFGKANVESGDSGDVSDFSISDGTPNSVFQFSDAPSKEYFNGNNVATFSRFHFETDAHASIVNYDILLGGRSHADRSQFIQYHLQDYYYDRFGPSITALTLDVSSGLVGIQTGGLQCVSACTATFGPVAAGAVPEPASWALMILGFGGLGAALRRHRGRPVVMTA